MDLLEVGRIVNTHGLRGEVKVVPWTDYAEVFEEISTVYLPDGTQLGVTGVKYQKNNIILKFSQINHIDEAVPLKGKVISASRDELGEPDGYYIADLIGLEVCDEDGVLLGKISDVLQTGANDVYEVARKGAKPLLLPVIDCVIKSVDLENSRVTVRLLDGLLDL